MKKTIGLLIVLGLAASPALAQKVTIDYAHEYDFDSLETFMYVDTEESNSVNPMMHDRIVSMLKGKLKAGGAVETWRATALPLSLDALLGLASLASARDKEGRTAESHSTRRLGVAAYRHREARL